MSMFISKALRRAEVFLEQVDESVAQASRRLVVEGATGAVDESEELPSDDEESTVRRASAIPRAEDRTGLPATGSAATLGDASFLDESIDDEGGEDAWGVDLDIDDTHAVPQPEIEAAPGEESSVLDDDTAEKAEKEAVASDLSNNPDEGPGQNTTLVDSTDVAPVDRVTESGSASQSMPDIPAVAAKGPMELGMGTSSGNLPLPPTAARPPRRFAPSAGRAAAQKVAPSTVSENDEYVKALKAESAELRKELEAVESDFEKSRRERSKLVKNLKRMKEIVAEMDESLREKSAEARDLETELITAKDEIAALRTKSREDDARGKDGMDMLRKELNAQIEKLQGGLSKVSSEAESLQEENERLKEALLHGHEVEVATADGARQDASKAHRAYEAETQAHRETREQAKQREESLEAEAALAAKALAAAQRKAEECTIAASNAKSAQRAAETKLSTVTSARDAAFARIEDLQQALSLYERGEGNEAPGQAEAKAMRQTVSELENALEAKNVELTRLEGELEAMRSSVKARRDIASPRAGQPGRSENANHEVEVKLRHMADAALRKQAQLEVLRSENRALQHQLSTERKRTREAQAMAAAASSSRQTIRGGFRGILDTGEEERGERMYGVRDGPLARFRIPRNWPRSVSKVVGGLDRFSAQALAFLRKEPLLRIVILVYLVAMHIFVYSLLHWHVDAVTGSVESPHESVASSKSGGQMRKNV